MVAAQLARRRFAVMKKRHERRWKEMWDSSTQRPFFFDSTTGEVRWRKPQALLNIMPMPKCSNCEMTDAVLECRECGEYYCGDCFSSIHAGGKRKLHGFRPLLDAYDKRVDYGDGDWPSIWPSELEQDEFRGWFPIDSEGNEIPLEPLQAARVQEAQGALDRLRDESMQRELAFRQNYSDYAATRRRELAKKDAIKAGLYDEGQPDWEIQTDANGSQYFLHKLTGDVLYDRPPDYSTPRPDLDALRREKLLDKWVRVPHPTEAGSTFFFHPRSGATSFMEPDGYESPSEGLEDAPPLLPPPAESSAAAILAQSSGWVKYWDETSQCPYWYSTRSNISTYDQPIDYLSPRDAAGAAAEDWYHAGHTPMAGAGSSSQAQGASGKWNSGSGGGSGSGSGVASGGGMGLQIDASAAAPDGPISTVDGWGGMMTTQSSGGPMSRSAAASPMEHHGPTDWGISMGDEGRWI